MSRYIDADKLCEGRVSNDPIVIAISCEPTADVKEIVHGEWEKYKKHKPMCKEIYNIVFRCSVCHRFSFHNGEMRKRYKFCPNCGADMRGKNDG